MAFQRPFLISLKRGDSSHKWGFSIKGGKDQCEPLVIQTVAEESLAEGGGLRQGDEIIQVGRVNVQDLSLGQVYELLARCGNKIEMFVVREDLFSPRKGNEPPVVKAVVHNPYNSPLSLYSTENIADTLARQTEVLTEGHISAEEEEGPENLSFKEKSAVFKLLEEQATQDSGPKSPSRGVTQISIVSKPKVAPPPPPKPKPPSEDQLYNGFDTQQQIYQDHQRTSNQVEYQSTRKVVNQYQYQQEQPVQHQQSSVYQVSSQQRSPGYHSPSLDQYQSPGYHSPVNQYQQQPGFHSPTTNYPQSQQHQQYSSQLNYQQSQPSFYQQYQTPVKSQPGNQSPSASAYQNNYQQSSAHISQDKEQRQQSSYQQQSQQPQRQQFNQQQPQPQQRQQSSQQQFQQQQRQQQTSHKQSNEREIPVSVSKVEFKIRPDPPPRNSSVKFDNDKMSAVYKQQYEQHLQQQYEQQQQMLMNNLDEDEKPKAHIINGNIFEHNSTSGTPITYKAPPVAPSKPHWPPPPTQAHLSRNVSSSGGMDVSSVWPPRKSTATEMPRTGFDPAAVKGQGSGRRCVWPPPGDEMRSGRSTPQSPVAGRKIQWNPSPSPPLNRRNMFSPSHSPARRKDIQWPPPSPNGSFDKENHPLQSPRMSRKARFDDYVKEHASINVPQTYRPPPGTQHVEFY